jgi:hypothetical protein
MNKKWLYAAATMVVLKVLVPTNFGEAQYNNNHTSPIPVTQSTDNYNSLLEELSTYLKKPSGRIDMEKKKEAWKEIMGLEVIVKKDSITFFPKPTEEQLEKAVDYYRNQKTK